MATPILIHGARRVQPAKLAAFRALFPAHAAAALGAEGSSLKALFAFPTADPLVYNHVIWCRDGRGAGVLPQPGSELEATYEADNAAPDVLHVYGGFGAADAFVERASKVPGVRYHFHEPLGGFIEADGAGLDGPPLFGFFRRRVKEGRVGTLATSFEAVCDVWRATVPGCLCATLSRDPADDAFVHDLRIFANKASYAAHVDKTNEELTARVATWFGNYDTTAPFSGALYGVELADESVRTSSVKPSDDTPTPEFVFAQFDWRQADMLGTIPDMTRGDVSSAMKAAPAPAAQALPPPINADGSLNKFPVPAPSAPMAIAAVKGDVCTLRSGWHDGGCCVSLTQPDEHGNVPLVWACDQGQAGAARFLLEQAGVDPNARGYLGNTALARAARGGHVDCVHALLAAPRIDPNICNDKQQYPLHFAAFKKKPGCVRAMINSGKCDLGVRDRKGRVPAEDTSDEEIRDMLLAAAADAATP